MSEFMHPPIDTELHRNNTMEQDFAERAYEILNNYHVDYHTFFDGRSVIYPATERMEFTANIADVDVALRLLRRQVFAGVIDEAVNAQPGALLQLQSSVDTHMVLELQFGTLDPEEQDPDEPIVDEDYQWHPYVQAIIELSSGDASLVDPANGHDLSVADVVHASYILEMLGRELRGEVYEARLPLDDDIAIAYTPLKTEVRELEHVGDLDFNFSCETCGAQNIICSHRSPQWN